MNITIKAFFITVCIALLSANSKAQQSTFINEDSVALNRNKVREDKVRLITYIRLISDPNGNKRIDQNVLGNFKLVKWLRLEAGLRQGERPGHLDSYYHYKLELQSKYFWKVARIIGRMSNDVINYPTPSLRKTNRLVALELKFPLGQRFRILAGGGFVSSLQNNVPDALPTSQGIKSNYPIFRFSFRYLIKRGFFEGVYGSYDVFNPYNINSPFLQLDTEHELSELCAFTTFLRYQYNNKLFRANNYFLGLGFIFHLVKDK